MRYVFPPPDILCLWDSVEKSLAKRVYWVFKLENEYELKSLLATVPGRQAHWLCIVALAMHVGFVDGGGWAATNTYPIDFYSRSTADTLTWLHY